MEQLEQSGDFAADCRRLFAPEHGRRWKTAAADALAIGRTTLYRYLNGEQLVPAPVSFEDGLQSLRQAIHRLQTETQRAPNPVLGPLSIEEWNQLHCRHCELHLSFLVPGSRP